MYGAPRHVTMDISHPSNTEYWYAISRQSESLQPHQNCIAQRIRFGMHVIFDPVRMHVDRATPSSPLLRLFSFFLFLPPGHLSTWIWFQTWCVSDRGSCWGLRTLSYITRPTSKPPPLPWHSGGLLRLVFVPSAGLVLASHFLAFTFLFPIERIPLWTFFPELGESTG